MPCGWRFLLAGFLAVLPLFLHFGLCMAARSGDELPVLCHCDQAEQGRTCKGCCGGDK